MATHVKLIVFLVISLLGLSSSAAAQGKNWRPVTPEELQMTVPTVESGADAEALHWEVRVEDQLEPRIGYRTILTNYLKIKIFNERGRDLYSKVELNYGRSEERGVETRISDIIARTTKSDGSTVSVKPADIIDKETATGNGFKLKAKVFALPGVEVGSIIEYSWKEIRENSLSFFVRLDLGREIPVRNIKYFLKPVMMPRLGMRIHSFKVTSSWVKEKDGFYSLAIGNVPAFRAEPFMPSRYQVMPWMLVYYEGGDEKATPAQYWDIRGQKTYEYHKSWLAPNPEIRRKTIEVIGDAADDSAKIHRIYDFCRKAITNVDAGASGLTPDQLKNVKENKSTSDVLTRGQGTWHDIQMLFGAMLASAGYDPRVANVSSHGDPRFDQSNANAYFNRTEIIAVKLGDQWRFYDPSSRYLPSDMLPASVEHQTALVSDPDRPFFVPTPVSPPDRSKQTRTAILRLDEDGTIEGDVRIEYTGHSGNLYKRSNDDASPAEREKALVEMVKRTILGTAEVTAVSIDNVTDTEKPFTYAFHLRLPAYGQKTGKRIFFQPNIFVRSVAPKFVRSDRRNDISFDHAWSETDEITIELPAGFKTESLEDPPPVREGVINLWLESGYSMPAGGSALKYSRMFTFGKQGELEFANGNYSLITRIFDAVQRSDTHGIIVRKD